MSEMPYDRWTTRYKELKIRLRPMPPDIQDAHQSGRWDSHWRLGLQVLVLLTRWLCSLECVRMCVDLCEWKHQCRDPDSKVCGANMGPTWGRQDPGAPHVDPTNLAVWECMLYQFIIIISNRQPCMLITSCVLIGSPMSHNQVYSD